MVELAERASVPCGGCRACCRHDMIFLHPEHGDKPETYQTVPMLHPIHKRWGQMLAKKKNGDCIYLGQNGCTIWDRAPTICRNFDCRKYFQKMMTMPRALRKAALRKGVIDREVLDRGKELLHTLKGNTDVQS